MGGIYDILESYRQQNDPRFIYDGLYQDPLYNIATANPLKAMSPGYEYKNSDTINRYLKSGAYDLSGNVPADYYRAIDFKRYFENRPLSTLDYGNRFQDFKPRVGFPNTSVFGITPENFSTTSIMQQAPLDMDRFKGVSDMSIIDETTNDEQDQNYIDQVNKNKSTGIMDLIMSIAVPGYGFLKNIGRGSLEGIRGLNQRIQQSDFGRSKTLADYFDARSYGGRDARDRAASQNMREARAIQQQVDRRGDSTSRIADRNRSSVTTSSAAKSKGAGGGGYTKSDSTRESFRGRY